MAIMCFLLSSQVTVAGDTEPERATLIGIETLYVVMDFDSESDSTGQHLNGSGLSQAVENQLGQANIATLTKEEYDNSELLSPWLYVRVRIITGQSKMRYVFSVYVAVVQPVVVARTMETSFGVTWFLGTLGYSDKESDIRESIRFNVDRFISALKSVNGN